MKCRTVVFSISLVSLLAIGLVTIPVRSPVSYGPKTDDLLIHVFTTPGPAYWALDTDPPTIDILQWPLTKTWIDTWVGDPRIEMRSNAEIAHMELDINNQRWPTGVTMPRDLDPETGTYKHYYDSTPDSTDPTVWDDEACEFRKAIAYLTDKEGYVTRILKGFGYAQETNVAYPECGGWVPVPPYTGTSGYSYEPITFDPAEAANVLDAAGFTQGSTRNPYWDPSKWWSAEYLRTDPRYGGNLGHLWFLIRSDDPNWRWPAANELTMMLRKSGIRVKQRVLGRTACLKRIDRYDYHLYTGGWSLTVDAPDDLYFLKHSAQYLGGTQTDYLKGLDKSANYGGFAHNGAYDPNASPGDEYKYYDYWAEKCHYPATRAEALNAGKEAQAIETNLVPDVPCWAMVAVKAYRSDWTGVENMFGYGVDNRWSFLNMKHPTDTIIDWGICSNLEGMNPVTCGTHPSLGTPQPDLWLDWKVFDLVYDPLIGRNPYNLADKFGWLAKDWTVGEWSPGKMYATFTLRSAGDSATARDPKFHNGDLVRPLDVAFSLIFMRDCGPAVAWAYSDVKDIVKVGIPPGDTIPTWLVGTDIFNDNTISSGQVKVYFEVKSYWALHWAGMQYVLNEHIWKAANDANGWGYNTGAWDRMKVRGYDPWVEDNDLDGTVDLKEDGTSAWVFGSATPLPVSRATVIALLANSAFYLSQDYISDYLDWAFHCAGDVNDDGEMSIADGKLISKASGTNMWTDPWGTGWDEYNPEADIYPGTWDMAAGTGTYGDGYINVLDLVVWGRNYGRKR